MVSDLNDRAIQILERLDIAAEYKAWGVEVTGTSPSPTGWVECHCHGRQDRNPSAGINVSGDAQALGRYKEHAGENRSLSFWDAGATFGPYSCWKDCRQHYAEQAGVELGRAIKVKDKPLLSPVLWTEAAASRFARQLEIDPAILRPTGASLMVKGGTMDVIAWPVWTTGEDPSGWYYRHVVYGKNVSFPKKDSKKKQRELRHMLTPGTACGFINTYACENMHRAEIVFLTEGISDCLSLVNLIRREAPNTFRKYAVVTLSHGAGSTPADDVLARLADKTVYIVYDADETGRTNSFRKLELLNRWCDCARLQLPYNDLTEKKDLRDWIGEGHTFEQLLTSCQALELQPRNPDKPPQTATRVAPTPVGEESDTAGLDLLLGKLGVCVVGSTEDGKVIIWSQTYSRWHTVGNIDRCGFGTFLTLAGDLGSELVAAKASEDEVRPCWNTVRNHIAKLSARNLVTTDNRYGSGVWQSRGDDGFRGQDLVIVTCNWAAVWDGAEFKKLDAPFYQGMVLDIGRGDQWIQFDQLTQLLISAGDRQWVKEVLSDARQMFCGWRWTSDVTDPDLIVGLVMATYLQDIWDWCPQVVICGESNTGKSMLMNVLEGVFTQLCFKVTAHSTEPGVRQGIGSACPPTLMDEWDTSPTRPNLLRMIRQASRGDTRATGSSHQRVSRSNLKQIFWLAGIDSGLTEQADTNRFIRLELQQPAPEDRGKLQPRSQEHLNELGCQLLAIALRYGLRASQLASSILEGGKNIENLDPRVLESYSVPTAMLTAAISLEGAAPQQALRALLTSAEKEKVQTDNELLMETILTQVVDAGAKLRRRSVGELIQMYEDPDYYEEAQEALMRECGILIDWRDNSKQIMFIGSVVSSKLLKLTDFKGRTISEILKRVPGAKKLRIRCHIGQVRCVGFQYEEFIESHGGSGGTK